MAAVPMVLVDTSALALTDLDTVEVCLDEVCVPLAESSPEEPWSDLRETRIDVVGDESQRVLVVRTIDGEALAGPQPVEIPTLYPNGEGCGGEALQGRYRVDPGGTFTLIASE